MRLLLDECLPRVLCAAWPEHHCRTVTQMRWQGFKNGALLTRASEEFDVFITVDKNLRFQQNLKKYRVAIVVVHARSNDYDDLKEFVPRIRAVLETIRAQELQILE